jgi:hypothetical protein
MSPNVFLSFADERKTCIKRRTPIVMRHGSERIANLTCCAIRFRAQGIHYLNRLNPSML